METKHVCPKCGQANGWHGPPFEGRWGKLKAIVFHLRRRTLFSKDRYNYPFVRCLSCGYVVSAGEYIRELEQVPRETEEESVQERLEREEFHRDHVEPHLQKSKAVRQDVSKFEEED
jgi:hypothetical protein